VYLLPPCLTPRPTTSSEDAFDSLLGQTSTPQRSLSFSAPRATSVRWLFPSPPGRATRGRRLGYAIVARAGTDSPNCMRELLRAVVTGKPIVALLEPEKRKGGLTQDDILEQLQQAARPCKQNGVAYYNMYAFWGLADELVQWGHALPSVDDLHAALFAREPIEWIRIGAFQVREHDPRSCAPAHAGSSHWQRWQPRGRCAVPARLHDASSACARLYPRVYPSCVPIVLRTCPCD
jgi:hypothetical protein